MSRSASILVFTLVFLIGVFTGFALKERLDRSEPAGPRYLTLGTPSFKHISPLLDCEMSSNYIEDSELKPFKHKVEKFINNVEREKWGDDISIYFRDLKNGPWFIIGKTEEFYPASLLKVPALIAVLKEADTNPAILKKEVIFNNRELESQQNFDVADKLVFGKSYAIEALVKRMILYSDNLSYQLLQRAIKPASIKKVYEDLSIVNPWDVNDKRGYRLSAETYSSFLRVLFNASYLSKEMSEKALQYLIDSDYKDGLVAGVPPNVEVAHKFGLRKINGIKQLHDCGIIYYPDHPYLLCVMTSGSVPEYLDHTIADISKFVFEEIDRQHHS